MKKIYAQAAAVLLSASLLTAPASAAGCSTSCCDILRQFVTSQLDIRDLLGTNWQLPEFTLPGQMPSLPTLPDMPDVPQTPETPETPDVSQSPLSDFESEVIRLVNELRVQNGLGTLAANEALSQVARYKSQDMAVNRYFSHESPTYGSPFQMMQTFGITYRTAGENIAYGQQTPSAVVTAWMNSEGHRANILNASYTQIGVGFWADGYYWTQMFIG